MKAIPSEPLDRRACLGAFAALLLSRASASPSRRHDPAMPNGTWKITAKLPSRPGTTGLEYLPDGTRIRLLIDGPTSFAVENDVTNELAARAAVVGPITEEMCRTGLGQDSMFGANICDAQGHPLPTKGTAPVDFYGVAVFSRIQGGPDAPIQEGFFADLGAKPGARLMSISFKEKGFSWRLWMKSADVMISKALLQGATRNDLTAFPLIWQRER